MHNIRIEYFVGKEIQQIASEFGDLRIRVFNDFPYLYEGSLEYENDYLNTYLNCEECIIIAIFDGDQLIGASSGLPLKSQSLDIKAPFIQSNFDINKVFYFGESIVLPEYRGNGFGHLFFDKREEHARKLGYSTTAFCSVIRPEDHPLKPIDHRSNEAFWNKRGYAKQEHMQCNMKWLDRGDILISEKPLQFWTMTWK